MNERIEKIINELSEIDETFVFAYANTDNVIELVTNASADEATDMMIASLSELRLGEE